MSGVERNRANSDGLKVTVFPEPSDEELLAITKALRLLEQAVPEHPPRTESAWSEIARQEGLRSRNWPPQVRSWDDRRS